MRNEIICELTRDLLPSYLEGLTSPASSEAIENHLKTCPTCTQIAEDMKAAVEMPQLPLKKDNDIKPFLKVKRRIRRTITVTILALLLAFGGYNYYFVQSFTPSTSDITITCDKYEDFVTIIFTSKSNHVELDSYVGGYHKGIGENEIDYVELAAFHKNPFKKATRSEVYFGYTFIDKDTVYDDFGKKVDITDQDYFAVQLKDKLLKINIADLYEGKITFIE